MENFFLSDHDVSPIIREKRKYSTFTVKEIGGPIELAAWRASMEKKYQDDQVKRQAFKDHQTGIMFGPNAPVGDGVTWTGKGDLRHGRGENAETWEQKLAYALERKASYMKPEIVTNPSAWEYKSQPIIKQTLFQKFKGAISRLWKSANF